MVQIDYLIYYINCHLHLKIAKLIILIISQSRLVLMIYTKRKNDLNWYKIPQEIIEESKQSQIFMFI